MKKVDLIEEKNLQNREIMEFVRKAKRIYDSFFDEKYKYDISEAVESLGVDEELIHQLIEDYITQVIKSVVQFEEMLFEMQSRKDAKQEIDYKPLRDLAHKNLGVARNLRIEDGVVIFNELMQKDDLEYLFSCVEVVRASVILLNPLYAFKTLKFLELEKSL